MWWIIVKRPLNIWSRPSLAKPQSKTFFGISPTQFDHNFMFSRSVSFGCLWKLLGESFLLLESLPAEVAVLRVPTAFLSNTKSCSSSELTREEINKLQALKFSSKAFCRALNIQPQNVSCWQGKPNITKDYI